LGGLFRADVSDANGVQPVRAAAMAAGFTAMAGRHFSQCTPVLPADSPDAIVRFALAAEAMAGCASLPGM
jgi:hypothetical protein